ncbi:MULTISPECIES: KTSC domain-containing protein [unclassified Duganella]|uniref:KTSC domain-containing protein n=1 Tax=unclassified Duganella TaxID=2636909 RepID=UPI000891A1BA|nr:MULTISPECIES: KTSC domain-containing protein [unclassified Duganella]SDF79673.1 KTSC domain-containing protein [Duganella sp. OV458]SDI49450.1 KTSC domain-containing protein [Duganella sp. OV510]
MHTANSIPLMKVASSKIHAIGHDPAAQVLAVQFFAKGEPGNVYHYSQFSKADYDAFAGAESIGKHFIAHIQPAKEKYPYKNLGVPSAVPVATTSALTKESLAVALHGREYPFDLSAEEQAQAKAAGLVVIFGASDDLMELRGAINDERGAPCTALIDSKGLLPYREDIDNDEGLQDYAARVQHVRAVDAFWAKEEDTSWTYRTDIPHATFEIMEDGIVYCRGIVISVADLGGVA